jgi:MoaA/NifB/PqqE/SkfB family radical SAM enzyme
MKPRDLRLLIMHVSTRCDQTCAHCSIWKGNAGSAPALALDERLAVIGEARALGARAILFTGGEPLLCDHIESLARGARALGLSVQMASNGLGLARSASWLTETVDELYLSLEGPEAAHDSVRGSGMFARLRASIAAVRARDKRPRLVGRSVVSSANAALLDHTVTAARVLGLDGVSFLPADSTSMAFGGDPTRRSFLRPSELDVAAMKEAIARLEARGELGNFVAEDVQKLTRMAEDFLAGTGRAAPACNAPEWSSVIEADGAVRPCFFQPATGAVGRGAALKAARGSEAYEAALNGLGPLNSTCAACVCPKQISTGAHRIAERVKAALSRSNARPRVSA